MCDCIKELEENLKNHLELIGVILKKSPKLDLGPIINDSEINTVTMTDVSWIENRARKNGDIYEEKVTTKMIHRYCPFCGEYKEKAKR